MTNTNNSLPYSNNDVSLEVLRLSTQLKRMREREKAMRVNNTLLQDALGNPATKAKKDKTFQEVFNLFIRSRKAKNSVDETIKNYKENINRFREFYQETYNVDLFLEKMDVLDEETIITFIEYMRNRGNSDSTINTRLRHLKTVIHYAYENRYIKEMKIKTFSVAVKKGNTIMEKEKDVRLLELEDVAKIFEIPETDSINDILDWITSVTLAELGVRCSSLWWIKRDDIDLVEGTIHLRHLKGDNDVYTTKYLSEKYIECLTYYFNLFDSHIEKMKEVYVASLEDKARKLKIPFQDYVKAHEEDIENHMPGLYPLCMKNDGSRIAKTTINDRAKRYSQHVLGTKKANAHAYRHSVGTIAASHGASPAQIAELLGHKDIASTMHYMHTTQQSKKHSDLAYSPSALLNSKRG